MNKDFIPVSTALWDPKWFHDFRSQSYVYIDKNGVCNGLRNEDLKPGPSCQNLCRGREGCTYSPNSCDFLKNYRMQLECINFSEFLEWCDALIESYKKSVDSKNPHIVLLFHEAPNNPCSERWAIKEWVQDNGMTCEEYEKK